MKIIRSNFLKYIIVLLIFGIWIFFFDDYRLSKQFELKSNLKSLQTKLQETEDDIVRCKIRNQNIKDAPEVIETIGRDNYYIKHDNEDVYIILKEDEESGELVLFE
jgi:cell division protein FtsB